MMASSLTSNTNSNSGSRAYRSSRSAQRQTKMNKEIGPVLKQRIREESWKINALRRHGMPTKIEILFRRLKIHYREAQLISSRSSHILIRGKCVIEVLQDREHIKDHMRDYQLQGAQVTFASPDPTTIRFLRWYDDFILEDGEPDSLEVDPEKTREFELNEEVKEILRKSFSLVNQTMSSDNYVDVIHADLKKTYKDCYKQRFVSESLMPDISITDMCVIDFTNRNRGLILSQDIRKLSHYMNELLVPAVLVNFHENTLSTILWLSCKENSIEITLEVVKGVPNEPSFLDLDPEVKDVIRLAVEDVNNDRSLRTEKEYKDKLYSRLKLVYENVKKDRYDNGSMPDLTIEHKCFIDIKARQRGIITLKEKEVLHKCMMTLKCPGVVVIFFNRSTIVILWMGSQNGNTVIVAESIGTDESGTRLIDLI